MLCFQSRGRSRAQCASWPGSCAPRCWCKRCPCRHQTNRSSRAAREAARMRRPMKAEQAREALIRGVAPLLRALRAYACRIQPQSSKFRCNQGPRALLGDCHILAPKGRFPPNVNMHGVARLHNYGTAYLQLVPGPVPVTLRQRPGAKRRTQTREQARRNLQPQLNKLQRLKGACDGSARRAHRARIQVAH